jgi:chromosome segregation ATPase
MTDSGTTSIAALQRRLAHYEDLNQRLNATLQQLVRLPQSELGLFTARMQDPDIAVPLLQCYDAALSEKQQQLDAANADIASSRVALRTAQAGHDDAAHAARLAEELARSTAERLRDDHERFHIQQEQLQTELHRIKERAQQLIDSESSLKAQLATEKQKVLDLSEALERARGDANVAEETLEHAQRKLKANRLQDNEERYVSETQKVQLQLIAKENDDKLAEIERLRGKMVSALRQQQDNHTAHLRIVEDRHRGVVEALRDELRTQEVQMLKLRAQFARADVSSPLGGGGQLLVKSATEVLESQSRAAQTVEIKRLYSELSTAQLQRDEATYRYDQLVASRKSDFDDRVAELRRDIDHQRARVKDTEDRNAQLQAEITSVKDQCRSQKEKCKTLSSEMHVVSSERDSALRRAEEGKKALARAEALVDQLRTEKNDAVAHEKRAAQSLERRAAEARQVETTAHDVLKQATEESQRQLDTMRNQINDLQLAKHELAAQLQERDRALEAQTGKMEKMSLGLHACKEQLLQCDERLVAFNHQEQQWKRDGRQLALVIEQLRMEAMRLQKDRDRAMQELKHNAQQQHHVRR